MDGESGAAVSDEDWDWDTFRPYASTFVRCAEIVFDKFQVILIPIVIILAFSLVLWAFTNPTVFSFMWSTLYLLGTAAEAAIDYNNRYPPSIYTPEAQRHDAIPSTSSGQDVVITECENDDENEAIQAQLDDTNSCAWISNKLVVPMIPVRRRRARTLPARATSHAHQTQNLSNIEEDEEDKFGTPEDMENISSTTLISGMILSQRARSVPSNKRAKTNFTINSKGPEGGRS